MLAAAPGVSHAAATAGVRSRHLAVLAVTVVLAALLAALLATAALAATTTTLATATTGPRPLPPPCPPLPRRRRPSFIEASRFIQGDARSRYGVPGGKKTVCRTQICDPMR